MNGKTITIVDYGVGNLYSVMRSFEVCGAEDICITSDPAKVMAADKVVLPGVGAFADGMQGLKERGLDKAICEFANSGRPLLGICLGMQLFATKSEEFGEHAGLGIIPGEVQMLPKYSSSAEPLKMPFIGWARILPHAETSWKDSLLEQCGPDECVYLIHSFQYQPTNPSDLLAIYHRDDKPIVAAIKRDNITGLQFHPEKSGEAGLKIISKFISINYK